MKRILIFGDSVLKGVYYSGEEGRHRLYRERSGELARAGIHLTESADDLMLLVDSAVWAYQNRDRNTGMPDWLRLRRRERWLQEKRRTGA